MWVEGRGGAVRERRWAVGTLASGQGLDKGASLQFGAWLVGRGEGAARERRWTLGSGYWLDQRAPVHVAAWLMKEHDNELG